MGDVKVVRGVELQEFGFVCWIFYNRPYDKNTQKLKRRIGLKNARYVVTKYVSKLILWLEI